MSDDELSTVPYEKVNYWMRYFKVGLCLLPYITSFKGCIGCVQMAQLAELRMKLKIILEQDDIKLLAKNRKYIFSAMILSMLIPSLIICVVA